MRSGRDSARNTFMRYWVGDLALLDRKVRIVASLAHSHAVHGLGLGTTMLAMARTTATFTISLPPNMMADLERVRRKESRTRSELVRESLRRYFAGIGEKEKLL